MLTRDYVVKENFLFNWQGTVSGVRRVCKCFIKEQAKIASWLSHTERGRALRTQTTLRHHLVFFWLKRTPEIRLSLDLHPEDDQISTHSAARWGNWNKVSSMILECLLEKAWQNSECPWQPETIIVKRNKNEAFVLAEQGVKNLSLHLLYLLSAF